MSYDKSAEDYFNEIEKEMKENGYKTKNQKKQERKKKHKNKKNSLKRGIYEI